MKIPEHIAIIMDGNGRWAKAKGLPRTAGHKVGVEKVKEIAVYANSIGVKCMTLYAFSTENWNRPKEEVNYLMSLPKIFFESYMKDIMKNNIKIMMIGNMDEIPDNARSVFKNAIEESEGNTGMILNFAVNYGGRREIVEAARKYAEDVRNGRVNDIDEEGFKHYLYTSALPEVDLLIRTSHELRISNYLLYQLAYSEMVFTYTLWPDFKPSDLDLCIDEYNSRDRRFGGLNEEKTA